MSDESSPDPKSENDDERQRIQESVAHFFAETAERFEDALRRLFEDDRVTQDVPEILKEAMNYSLLAGGKRLRPALCLASAERSGCSFEEAFPLAAAFEMIHTASLIHDDLPCMDNDELRRGKPTNHVVYGEDVALYAGNGLMMLAFEYPLLALGHSQIDPRNLLNAISLLAEAAGPSGVCGGQVLDSREFRGSTVQEKRDYVGQIAYSKTAMLLRAAVVAGAALGGLPDEQLACYYQYGTHLGLAFQIVDDILDVTANSEQLGKTPGKDAAQNKVTYVDAYGLEGARELATEVSEKAVSSLAPLFPQGDVLLDLPLYLVERTF